MGKSPIKGYRLHDARIAKSRGTNSIRSIKYELIHSDNQTFNAIYQAIRQDYHNLYGNISLDDFLEKQDDRSILGFWLQSLAAGGLFSYKSSTLIALARHVQGKTSEGQQRYDSMPNNIKAAFNRDAWVEVFCKACRNHNPQTLERKFNSTLVNPDNQPDFIPILRKSYIQGMATKNPEEQARIINTIFQIKIIPAHKNTTSCLTFYIEPKLIINPASNKTELLKNIEASIQVFFQQTYQSEINDNQLKEMMGVGSNGNALSNYLNHFIGLLTADGGVEKLLDEMNDIRQYSKDELGEVTMRLERLVNYVKYLPKPNFSNSWADYRSEITGRLESMLSNSFRRMNETKEQLQAQRNELSDKLLPIIIQKTPNNNLIEETKNLITLYDNASPKPQLNAIEVDVLQQELSSFRSKINEWYQAYFPEENEDNPFNKTYSKIAKDIKKLPNFFGESKYKQYMIYERALRVAHRGFELTTSLGNTIMSQINNDDTLTEKDLEALRKWQSKLNNQNSLDWVNDLKHYGLYLSQIGDFERFFIAKQSRNNKLKLIEHSYKIPVAILWRCINLIEVNEKDYVNKTSQAIDYLELLKCGIGILCRHIDKPKNIITLLNKFQVEYPEINAYLELLNTEPEGLHLSRILSAYLFAHIKGTLALVSRKTIIVRRCLATLSGDQASLLVKTNGQQDNNDLTNSLKQVIDMNNRKYAIQLEFGKDTDSNYIKIAKSDNNNRLSVVRYSPEKGVVLQVQSSKYQIQFLDWFIKKPKHKTNTLSMSGSFLISEQTYAVSWSKSEPHFSPQDHPRIFLSIPFTILPPEQPPRNNNIPIERYIGIDVGEYGLAWTIIEEGNENIRIIDRGFITDKQYDALQDSVRKWKNNQVTGTFSSSTTHLASLRESLVGSLRNQLHALMLKYNAKIVFEDSISGFEEGGNRIKKVYSTVKKADVYSNTQADKAAMKQAWGDGRVFKSGMEVVASGTSQMCSKCHQDATSINLSKNVVVNTTDTQGIIRLNVDGISLFAFSNVQDYSRWKIIDYKKAIKGFMRPPLGSTVLESKDLRIDKNWLNKRGNSAIFVCPFCQHISDADLQASYNIAVKGLLKTRFKNKPANKKIGFTNAVWRSQVSKLMSLPIIELNN